ncbi:MAG: sigma-E factor negative regulatory protein [Pseudomonadota bacterium]
MTNPIESLPSGLPEQTSAFVDGELNAREMADFWTQLGAQGEEVRADWHAFQLIGDVLRSEDLASTAQHDAAFLQALRERFQTEPVVLAPVSRSTPAAGGRGHRGWAWPSAAAVGVVMVSAAVWNARVVAPGTAPVTLVQAPAVTSPAGPPAASALSQTETVVNVGRSEQRRLIRDPQIDRYLAAHQQFVGSSALGAPSGFIRNAAVDVPRH